MAKKPATAYQLKSLQYPGAATLFGLNGDLGPLFAAEHAPGVWMCAFGLGPQALQWLTEHNGMAAVTVVLNLNTRGLPNVDLKLQPVVQREAADFAQVHVEKLVKNIGERRKKKSRIIKPK